MVIHVIVDVSGSMNEMGKSFLLINLVRFITELKTIYPKKFSQIEFSFFKWNNLLLELNIDNNENILTFDTANSADLTSLQAWLETQTKQSSNIKLILLSDGSFSIESVDLFKHWCQAQSNLTIRTIAVGADANNFILDKISSNAKTYKAENISSVINSLLTIDHPLSCPKSINNIVFSSLGTKHEEDWDE